MHQHDAAAITFASGFSLAAHAGQKRKFTGEDYYEHPKRVSESLYHHGYTDVIALIAALLHDVVEDTHVTLTQIRAYFGDEVAELVGWLTKTKHPHPMRRDQRKEIEVQRLKNAPAIVKTIKLADRLDNMTMLKEEPDFAPIFAAETRRLLDVALKDGGDPVLWAKIDAILREYQQTV